MKTCILVCAILGSAAAALASASDEPIALPEVKADTNSSTLLVQQVLPEYPYELRRAGETGRVSLDLVVDPDGRVLAVKVLDADNHALADAARAAVRRWRFVPLDTPPTIEHRHARVTFSFELKETA